MKVGLGEWGFRELPFEEHCRIAADFGFHYLELGIGGDFPGRLDRNMDASAIKQVNQCIQDYRLSAPFVCLENDFTLADLSDLRTMIARTKDEIQLCRQLGATQVRLFTGFELADNMTEERWALMLGAFREVNEWCRTLGLSIAIETHGQLSAKGDGFVHRHTTSTDWASLQRLLRELPSDIGINFDPGNLKPLSSRHLTDYARLLGNRITYCHLKDWKQMDGAWVACAVGDDDIDWKSLLGAMSYNGVYLIEYEPVHDVEDGIRRSLAHLRSVCPAIAMK